MDSHNLTSFNQTDHFNNTNTVEEGDLSDDWEIPRLIQLVFKPMVIIFGTFGNVLSFIVMRRGSLKDVSTCFYMSILAVADTGLLWTGGLVHWVQYLTEWRHDPAVWTRCKISEFLYFFCRHYSSGLLVFMSIEKFIALYFPLKSKLICTVKTAKWVCGISAVLYGAYNSPLIILSKRTEMFGYVYCDVHAGYWAIFRLTDSVLYSFGPFSIMIIMNSAIIIKFMLAKRRNTRGGTESTSQALSKVATRGTLMLVTVSAMFILLTGPLVIGTVLEMQFHPMVQILVFTVPQYLNHSINADLYCIVGTRFRKELIDVLCYHDLRQKDPNSISIQSERSERKSRTSPSVTTVTEVEVFPLDSNRVNDQTNKLSPLGCSTI